MTDVHVERRGLVAIIEMRPDDDANWFDEPLLRAVADAILGLDGEPGCRAIVLASTGRHFCAGARLTGSPPPPPVGIADDEPRPAALALYDQAVRMLSGTKPIVAAVAGAAIGGGLGLALVADFRVAAPESRFAANFARLGFFPGFGITVTLPAVVGTQRALDLLATGRRVGGEEAFALGLCDRLVPDGQVRQHAHELAVELATSAPLSVPAIRRHLRGHLAAAVHAASREEATEQARLSGTGDFREGVAAMAARRPPRFVGR